MPDSKRGLTKAQWNEVRVAYGKGESVAALSRRFGVRRQTIMEHRDREAWTVQVTAQVSGPGEQRALREKLQSNVIDFASRRAVEQAQESGLIDEIASEILATQTANRLAAEFIVDFLTKAKAGQIKPSDTPATRDEAQVAKDVMGAFKIFTSTTRENAGRVAGQATVKPEGEAGDAIAIQWDDDVPETA